MGETKLIDYWQDEIDRNRMNPKRLYITALKVLALAAKRSLEFKPKDIAENSDYYLAFSCHECDKNWREVWDDPEGATSECPVCNTKDVTPYNYWAFNDDKD